MSTKQIAKRIASLPRHHKLIAVGIALASVAGMLTESLITRQYTGAAILAFDEYSGPHLNPSGSSAIPAADAALSPDRLLSAASSVGLYPNQPADRQLDQIRSHLSIAETSEPSQLSLSWSGNDAAESIRAANAFAAVLTSSTWSVASTQAAPSKSLPAPSATQVAPAAATVPSVTNLEQTPVSSLPHRAANSLSSQERVRLEDLHNDRDNIQTQLDNESRRLAALETEQHNLEAAILDAKAKTPAHPSATAALQTQLAAAKKKLEDLRTRYTDDYPDVQTVQEQVADLQKQIANAPAPPPNPWDGQQARLNSLQKEMGDLHQQRDHWLARLQETDAAIAQASQHQPAQDSSASGAPPAAIARPRPMPVASTAPLVASRRPRHAPAAAAGITAALPSQSFSIQTPAESAEPSPVNLKLLLGFGTLSAILWGALYLVFALWWCRPVQGTADLLNALPPGTAYLGAIPEMHR